MYLSASVVGFQDEHGVGSGGDAGGCHLCHPLRLSCPQTQTETQVCVRVCVCVYN